MADPLDDLLSAVPAGDLRRPKRLLAVLREACTVGVPPLALKSTTDRLGEAGGWTAHLGTPDDVLRRIASWVLTVVDDAALVLKVARRLWERHGREDLELATLLLANLDPASAGDSGPWAAWVGWLHPAEPVTSLASAVEELMRGSPGQPEEAVRLGWLASGDEVVRTVGLLASHSVWMACGRGPVSEAVHAAVREMDTSAMGQLIARVHGRLLAAV